MTIAVRDMCMGTPFADPEIDAFQIPDSDWTRYAQLLKALLCGRYGFAVGDYLVFEIEFAKRFLAPFTSSGKFHYRKTGPPINDFPWELFENSMEDGVKGFCEANFREIRDQYAMHVKMTNETVDGRIFLPGVRDVVPAKRTGRRDVATTKCTPSVRDLTKTLTLLSRTRTTSPMMITPIVQRRYNQLPPCPSERTTVALKEKFATLLSNDTHTNKLSNNAYVDIPISFQPVIVPWESTQVPVNERNLDQLSREDPGKVIWPLGIRLYRRFVNHVSYIYSRSRCSIPLQVVLQDVELHRALLVLALEVIRFVWKIETPSFGSIFEELNPAKLTFVISLDLITETDAYMPATVYARLKCLQDDVMEYLIWNDGTMQSLQELSDVFTGHSSSLSPLTSLYGEVFVREFNDARDVVRHRDRFLHVFMQKLKAFSAQRARAFCDRINIKIQEPESFVSRVVRCVEYVVVNFGGGLMENRHLDSIILCAVHAVSKVVQYVMPFKDLKTTYLKQMGSFREATDHIPFDGRAVGIVEFYNEAFVPIAKNWDALRPSQSFTPPGPSPKEKMQWSFSSPGSRGASSPMTPATKRLWNFAETPSKTPSPRANVCSPTFNLTVPTSSRRTPKLAPNT
ncbi:hypothetical protein M427DRAFT_329628 [Gonapodya prolifera JEL478]|uniref:Retinoblastoma-associated protein A-box domain-containing protein n=1 Tax=Gonapodya prolifera (strain JEL478) TaxID=1344416 RepID=A0A139AEC5_GONPJ|nr:hypothetical protein M427DRAFT_329628 [Gonapodya prolifera JEL478]|eukprot:KXS15110.1 hypothetical protein M427DRAFT_329628 [Gonapodya prolifera JEL478]